MRPNMLISALMISNEAEDMSGRTSAEIERVLYARVGNFDFLDKANGVERQEQWSVKIEKNDENSGSGSIRVRKSVNLREPGAPAQYVLTTKLDVGQQGSSAETPEQSSEDQFKVFKYFGNKGMLKDRYYYDIPGTDLRWEVDCFPKEGTLYDAWVKIDLEKWPRGKPLPQLPFEALELIDGTSGYLTEENEPKVKELYNSVFLIPNQMSPLVSYEQPPEAAQPESTGTATDEEGQQKDNDKTEGQENNGTNDDDAAASGNENAGGTGGSENDDDNADGSSGAGTDGNAEGTGSGSGDDDDENDDD